MSKYKVLVVSNDKEIRINLRSVLGREDEIALVGFANMDTNVMTKVSGYAPHVVLLVNSSGDTGVMEIAQKIYQGYSGCAVVLLTQSSDDNLLTNAMLSGIRRVIHFEEMDILKDALVETATFEKARGLGNGKEPRVVSVYSAKGGCGKTMLTVNLATALAKIGRRTALLDFCLNYGDSDLFLNIKAKETIAELVQEKNNFTIDDIRNFSVQHANGLTVLCSPLNPKYAEYVTEQHVEEIINIMRPYYDFIFVDLPSDLSDCTLAALENSDNILFIARRDIPSLRAGKSVMNILSSLHLDEKVTLIINPDQKSVLKNSDFERVLNIPVEYCIPKDEKTAMNAQEIGDPFVVRAKRLPIAKVIIKIAKYCLRSERSKVEK